MNVPHVVERLRARSRQLIDGNNDDPLGHALRAEFANLKSAYVIDWIPEQCEDIYTVVVGPQQIVAVEIERREPSTALPIIEHFSLKEYRTGLPNLKQRLLATAIKLAHEDAAG
jgi:hypothetical protein